MYQSLDLFQTAIAMARHAGTGQAAVARNIANSDTPGFRAQQIVPFADAYAGQTGGHQRVTRAGHMMREATFATRLVGKNPTSGEPAPNGNNVSIEDEMLNSVALGRDHTQALTIYRHTMTVLRASLGN